MNPFGVKRNPDVFPGYTLEVLQEVDKPQGVK